MKTKTTIVGLAAMTVVGFILLAIAFLHLYRSEVMLLQKKDHFAALQEQTAPKDSTRVQTTRDSLAILTKLNELKEKLDKAQNYALDPDSLTAFGGKR